MHLPVTKAERLKSDKRRLNRMAELSGGLRGKMLILVAVLIPPLR
jgi:hypothetical protein